MSDNEQRLRGKVVAFFAEKGFGFIKRDDRNADLFFHVKALMHGRGQVGPGDVVEFVVEEYKGRLRARDVDFVAPGAEAERVWTHPGVDDGR
jgi:cold shock CspA family protein